MYTDSRKKRELIHDPEAAPGANKNMQLKHMQQRESEKQAKAQDAHLHTAVHTERPKRKELHGPEVAGDANQNKQLKQMQQKESGQQAKAQDPHLHTSMHRESRKRNPEAAGDANMQQMVASGRQTKDQASHAEKIADPRNTYAGMYKAVQVERRYLEEKHMHTKVELHQAKETAKQQKVENAQLEARLKTEEEKRKEASMVHKNKEENLKRDLEKSEKKLRHSQENANMWSHDATRARQEAKKARTATDVLQAKFAQTEKDFQRTQEELEYRSKQARDSAKTAQLLQLRASSLDEEKTELETALAAAKQRASELEEIQLEQARALEADQSRADMMIQQKDLEIQQLKALVAKQSRSAAWTEEPAEPALLPEEPAVSDPEDDGIDGRFGMDSHSDFDPHDIANVALPEDAEPPHEEKSEGDPDLNDGGTEETISADGPVKRRRVNPEDKWNNYNHPQMAGKKIIWDKEKKTERFYVLCKWCSKENDESTWFKMRPWDGSHFDSHMRTCKKYKDHLDRSTPQANSMRRFIVSKTTPEPEEAQARPQGSNEQMGSTTTNDPAGNSVPAEFPPCMGVPNFVFAADLEEPLKDQCSNLFGQQWVTQLLHTSTMLWYEVEKDASDATLCYVDSSEGRSLPTIFSKSCTRGRKVGNPAKPWDSTPRMVEVSDTRREKVPDQFCSALGSLWRHCSQCAMLAEKAERVRKPTQS